MASTSLATWIHSTRSASGHHLGGAGRQGGRVGEVIGEPAAQGLGLADVEHPAVGVEELVGAGGVGDEPAGGG